MTRRTERVAQEVKAALARLLLRDVNDPAIAHVVVTDVRLAADLNNARVYWRLLVQAADVARARPAAERALRRATGFLRTEVGRAVGLRSTPSLEFHYDEGQDDAMRVDALLHEIGKGGAGGAGGKGGKGGRGERGD